MKTFYLENGYQHLTVHVEGSVNFDRIKLEKLRDGVARLLCIPPQFVVVDGIEPGNSFLITFSIAEEHIDFVFEMQQGDSDYIIAEGVDFVKVKEKVVNLKCKICFALYDLYACFTYKLWISVCHILPISKS